MILEIRLANFFSIRDEVTLDLRAASINSKKAKALKGNQFSINDNQILKSVAIYGANASGKSNIVKAIRFCCRMVFQSHSHNEDVTFNFSPYKFDGYEDKPSSFFIRFLIDHREYEYAFALTRNEIIKESLHYYKVGKRKTRTRIFERDEHAGKTKREKYKFSTLIKRPFDVAENTSKKTLYISRASQMDRELGKEIFRYFNEKFILQYFILNNEILKHRLSVDKAFLLSALQIADSDIVDIDYEVEKVRAKGVSISLSDSNESITQTGEQEIEKIKLVTYHKHSPKTPFDFETEESDGTKKLLYVLLNVIDIIQNGKILLIDEIESSLHSSIVEFIVDLFHKSENSQIIFSTHNTNLIDLNKVRKDQIYFVDKDETGNSTLYSLYDFKDFRENMDAEKGYLQGRFDAIPYLSDPSSLIIELENG